jgi:hypothetical protein
MYPAEGNRVKVSRSISIGSAVGRVALTVVLSAIMFSAINVAPAQAITRKEVIKRANHWIKKKVMYSQSRYYRGYRRDCSGFVSMAWKLKRSYTSSSIRGVARRISASRLKPGDAVRRTGHVEIFAGWKSKRKRTYWALLESQSGKPAMRKVKRFKRGYSALRLRGIKDDPKKVAPKRRPVIPPAPLPSVPTTSTEPSSSTLPTDTPSDTVTPTPVLP